jgi:NAD(P)-dependent dehydrogenase (short-subunit alcohol dehydrogenase family)
MRYRVPRPITAFIKQVASILGGPEKEIDFLLNNAGINATPKQTSLILTPESLSEHINVNAMGPAEAVQILESHLQDGSVVMNMTSGLSLYGGVMRGSFWCLSLSSAEGFRHQGV